jgi:hypothetical protein
MYAHTTRFLARSEVYFGIIIEQEEGAHALLAHIVAAGKEVMYPEAIANHMGRGRC